MSKHTMETQQKNGIQAWGWAIAINLVVFAILWFGLGSILNANQGGTRATEPVEDEPSGPGETFGQMTRLIGDSDDPANVSVQETEPGVTTAELDEAGESVQWVSEFYLDVGPAISFSPRLNEDGTPRSHPADLEWEKSPTYEEENLRLTADEYNPPTMSPPEFSILDLPEEYRDMDDISLYVWVNLDARGNLLRPPFVHISSGHPIVDEMTIEKIQTDVTFTQATRKDNGQPTPMETIMLIVWEHPG